VPVCCSWIRFNPAPALFTKVPGAVCCAGIRRLPVFPKVSIPSPLERSALSRASWGFSSFCDCCCGGGGAIGLNEGVLLLKFVAVRCSDNVARVGLAGVEAGRAKDDANGLLEPVGVGFIAIAEELPVAQGLLVFWGIIGSGCCWKTPRLC